MLSPNQVREILMYATCSIIRQCAGEKLYTDERFRETPRLRDAKRLDVGSNHKLEDNNVRYAQLYDNKLT